MFAVNGVFLWGIASFAFGLPREVLDDHDVPFMSFRVAGG
jgi:hypothetical protein